MKQFILFLPLLLGAAGFAQNNAIFGGGNGDGWAYAFLPHVTNNIYVGGEGDGWSVGSFLQPGNNIYNGGNGDGWSSYTTPPIVLGVVENEFSDALSAYPNPMMDEVFVDLGKVYQHIDVEVLNVLGQAVSRQSFNVTDKIALKIDGQEGTYFLRLTANDKKAIIKIIRN